MKKCFVIQPFDNGTFDRRFQDVFLPAIENAGLEAYRVDSDPSVRIPIDDIEKNIQDSEICFAEITTDNPNVWYELGFAFACRKDVVMVCSDEREGSFPFDIQHRHILKYSTTSKSDFEKLEQSISDKIKAFLKKSETVESLHRSPPVKASEDLDSHEIAMLILIMEKQLSPEDDLSVYELKDDMNKSGYTDIATSMGIRTLKAKSLIETFIATEDEFDRTYTACRLTKEGDAWLFENSDKIKFRIDESDVESDELPF